MKKTTVCLVFVISIFAIVPFINAEGVGATVKIGTLGVGADITVGLSEACNLRCGINALSLDMDFESDDDEGSSGGTAEDVDLELSLMTAAALLDWHPFNGHFRLTGGVMLNNNEVDVTAPGRSVELNGRDYEVSDLSGNVAFNELAPYVGIGGGNAVDENGRLTFAWDIGVMLQGDPDVTLSATAVSAGQQAQLDADISEEIKDIEDDTDSIALYPVVMIGIGYRF